jgi:hypothetical protein
MKHKVYLFILTFFLTLLFGCFDRVSACTCAAVSPCAAYYQADLVFIGKVVSSKQKKVKIKDREDKEIEVETDEFNFEVKEIFKGGDKISKISISGESTTCDFPFKQDETYLVFAYKIGNNEYITSTCSHTNKLSDAEEDLKFLREVLPKPDVEICLKNTSTNYTTPNLLSIFFP